jgi:hypothetical protein
MVSEVARRPLRPFFIVCLGRFPTSKKNEVGLSYSVEGVWRNLEVKALPLPQVDVGRIEV